MITSYDRNAQAVRMLRVGFRVPVVVAETGMTALKVRRMARDVDGDGRGRSGSMPAAYTMAASSSALMDISLFAALYRSMGGEAVLRSIDIEILISAYNLYLEVRESHLSHVKPVLTDINRAWVIARDIRSDLAWLETCEVDGYHLTVNEQRTPLGCPWCQCRRASSRKRSKGTTETAARLSREG